MKVNTPLLIGASLMLVAAALPLPLAAAHLFCFGGPGACDEAYCDTHPGASCVSERCGDGEPHSHTEVWTEPPFVFECDDPGDIWDCPHPSPHSHNYGFGGSVGAKSDTVTGGEEAGAGVVTVFETNIEDCNKDGVAGDYDGDWETGVGGGFFGYGQWADEPLCNYGLTTHGAVATVTDLVFGGNVAFVIGADDTGGPAIDPVSGECTTDGSITPGDPATDPTADADDCLTDVYVGSGPTCGAGGDGGYWVFLNGALVTEGAGGVGSSNPPTTGTITA